MALILLLSYSGSFGGAERVLLEFAGALPGERVLACPEGPLAAAARRAGVRVLVQRSGPLRLRGGPAQRGAALAALSAHALTIRRLVGDLDPDLVIASGLRSALATLALPHAHPPLVLDHHDLLPGPAIGGLLRAASRRAELTVVPSRAVADELSPAAAVTVVTPGIELERFASDRRPAVPPVVLVLGALTPVKSPGLALDAVALARDAAPELRLRYAGAPLDAGGEALSVRLRRRAAELGLEGAVEFAGAVDEVPAELGRATVLLHCGARESFGLALIEAMAAGRPVVAPAAAGSAEIVDPACGMLYSPGDARAAGGALAEVLGDPVRAQAMGAAGRKRAIAEFDVRRSRGQFAAAVGPLIRRRRPPAQSAQGLGIVTVSHNSASALEALLASVARHLPDVEVVVVDCASGDESIAVAGRCRHARVMALGENVGFGAACNRGVAELSAPVCALLNPDVELLDGSLLELASAALAAPALLAPLVLWPDGRRQDTVHPVPGSWADLARVVVPYTVAGPLALAPWRARRPRGVGWAVGCALVARTELLGSLGPFDESIFMYGEDLELGLRAAAAGVETRFDPRARVIHHGAHSTRSAFLGEATERLAHTRRQVIGERLGPAAQRRDDIAAALTYTTRIAARQLLRRPASRELGRLRALREAWRAG